MYPIQKRKLPKKNKNKNIDIANIRCIIMAVCEQFQVNAELLSVTQNRYETYIDCLLESKVLIREKNSKGYNIENFVLLDVNKINEYKNYNTVCRHIEKIVIPIFCALMQGVVA